MTFSAFDVVLLIAFGLLSLLLLTPLDTFTSWAGWGSPHQPEPLVILDPADSPASPKYYLVFLDGISKGSHRDARFITDFLAELRAALPEGHVISDLLPYSVFDLELTSRNHSFSRFWSWVEQRKIVGNPLGFLINLHNLSQVMVAADARYGPLYNVGMTKLILLHLLRHGYQPSSKGTSASEAIPIILIGYSGGGQVAAGSAPLLARILEVPVKVVSIAGVMAGNASFADVKRWYQVMSNKDPVEKLGAFVFPQRWRFAWFSPWNRARRSGTVQMVPLDGARHDNNGSYMDKQTFAPDGRSLLERTVATIAYAVQDDQ